MKQITCLAVFIFLAAPVFPDSVFLKDGSIIEGKIAKQDDVSVELTDSSGGKRTITVTEILRITGDIAYKQKRFFRKKDHSVIEAFVVAEDQASYKYRTNLDSPQEISLLKTDVESEITMAQSEPDKGTNLVTVSVFLKNGAIIEGPVSGETDGEMTLKTSDGGVSKIARSTILRVLYNESYKQKVYLYKKDQTYLQGYIVAETADAYTCRTKLDSAGEITVRKKEIVTTSQIMIPTLTKLHYFYLNDGRILEGWIDAETADTVRVENKAGDIVEIAQSKIARRSFVGGTAKRHFVSKDGNSIDAWLIDETDTEYICRKDISKPEEAHLKKTDTRIVGDTEMNDYRVKMSGYWYRGVIPGAAQFSTDHNIQGTIFLSSFVSAGLFLGYETAQYYSAKKKYDGLNSSDSRTDFQNARNDYKKASKRVNLGIGLLAGVYAFNFIDMYFTRPSAPSFYRTGSLSAGEVRPAVSLIASDGAASSGLGVSFGMTMRF
jgi:hypothetical protein